MKRNEIIAYQKVYYSDPSHKKRRAELYLLRKKRDPAAERLRQNNYRRRYPEKFADANLRARCGATIAQKQAIFESQGKKCAICGSSSPRESKRRWALDHDHKTGRIRSVLCYPCNTHVGWVEAPGLEKVMEYLRKWSPNQVSNGENTDSSGNTLEEGGGSSVQSTPGDPASSSTRLTPTS